MECPARSKKSLVWCPNWWIVGGVGEAKLGSAEVWEGWTHPHVAFPAFISRSTQHCFKLVRHQKLDTLARRIDDRGHFNRVFL